jgi:uncharacterized protein (TIGR04141 family)
MSEDAFNKQATAEINAALLMDKKLVSATSQTTPIELCDILTAAGDLMHVKRHFGSSDPLSHQFSQGLRPGTSGTGSIGPRWARTRQATAATTD